MFNFIKNLFNRSKKYNLTPKGKTFLNYLKDNNLNKTKIEAYEESINRIDTALKELSLQKELEFLKKNPYIKKIKVKITNNTIGEQCWYSDEINKTFNVYDYNKSQYMLTGNNFGFLINKVDVEILE